MDIGVSLLVVSSKSIKIINYVFSRSAIYTKRYFVTAFDVIALSRNFSKKFWTKTGEW